MSDVFFAEAGPLVELTYGRDGKPIFITRGKKRDAEKDQAAALAWMRALRDQIAGVPA